MGAWPAVYERLFCEIKHRFGETEGTRELLCGARWHRDSPTAAIEAAVTQALDLGGSEAAAMAV
jgi:hypothetical protein